MRKSTVFGLLIALASLGAGAACSSTATTTPDPATDGGGTPKPDGSTTDPDGGKTGGATKGGAVSLTQTSFTVGTTTSTSYSAGASFYNATGTTTGTPTNTTCTTSTDSGCTVIICDKVTADGGTTEDAGAPATPPNAGDITVEALKTLTLSVGEGGAYTGQNGQEKLFASGGQIHISAVGADVPAFDDTIASPPSITLTAPVIPALGAGTYEIDGSKALALTWTGGAAGSLQTLITAANDTQSSILTCTFDASTGSANISQAAMGKLLKGKGVFAVSTQTISAIKAGDYSVSLTASASAATASSEVK